MTSIVLSIAVLNVAFIDGILAGPFTPMLRKLCPGYCIMPDQCSAMQPSGTAYTNSGCPKENQVCCLPKKPESCGQVIKDKRGTVHFVSPNFPSNSKGNLVCTFEMELNKNLEKIAISLVNFDTEEKSIFREGGCDNDKLFIMGFEKHTPSPLCGYRSGQQIIIDKAAARSMKKLVLVALMSSNWYRWLIEIKQVNGSECRQFHHQVNETKRTVRSVHEAPQHQTLYQGEIPGPVVAFNGAPDLMIEDESPSEQSSVSSGPGLHVPIPMILEGQNTKDGEVPWQASLRLRAEDPTVEKNKCNRDEGVHFCGGSIISETEILTAAHCFNEANTNMPAMLPLMKVVVGDWNKCRDPEGFTKGKPEPQEFLVSNIKIHYDYEGHYRDIAIVEILGKITFNERVQKIALAAPGSNYTGQPLIVSGWGSVSWPAVKSPDVLQVTRELAMVPSMTCSLLQLAAVSKGKPPPPSTWADKRLVQQSMSELCTTSSKKGSMASGGPGDSGGPAVVYDNGIPILVGVTGTLLTTTPRTASSKSPIQLYNGFASVAYYRNWIASASC